MRIQTNTWHYTLYRFSFFNPYFPEFGIDFAEIPTKTNLCNYVWRVTVGALFKVAELFVVGIFYVVVAVALVLFMVVLHVVVNLVTIPLGYGIFWIFSKHGDEFFNTPFKVSVNGTPRYVAWGLVPLYVIMALSFLTYVGFTEAPTATIIFFKWLGFAVSAILTSAGLILWFHSESFELVSEFVKAKKVGICPLVEFVDAPSWKPKTS